MDVLGPVKARLRARYGVWPLLELRNRLRHGPSALAWSVYEHRELARLRRAVGPLPPARVATIVPTFRRPELLAAAVRSALAQTVTDQLVVVVDDGGGQLDGLPVDDRLVVVSLSRNTRRLGLVRNVGIRLTSTRYVAFLDDDNEWRPDHLEVAVQELENGADLVYTALERIRVDGSRLDILSRPFDRRSLVDESAFVDANSVVVRRPRRLRFSVIRRTKTMYPKEDLEFVLRMSRHLVVRHVAETTVRYLLHEASYFTIWGGGTLGDTATSGPHHQTQTHPDIHADAAVRSAG